MPAYRLFDEFTDGVKGEVDLSERSFGPVFDPVKDREIFNRVDVVCWPNGADLAPDALHENLAAQHGNT